MSETPGADQADSTNGTFDASTGTVANGGSAANGSAAAQDAGIDAAGTAGVEMDECGQIPSQPASGVTSGRVMGSGLIEYAAGAPNAFIGLRTTLTVPAEPPGDGPVFVWPGVQPTPDAMNLQPIGNGAVLSALTWGDACAADVSPGASTWWIAPMYTNLSTTDPSYAGCHSGKVLLAEPEQLVDIDIHLDGTTWVQEVVNRDTTQTSEFSFDLEGQQQGRLIFAIDLRTSNAPTDAVVFTNTVLSMAVSDPDACRPVTRGISDFASTPRVSLDGTRCCIDRVVLRAPGVAEQQD